jgi:hypothetical protein
MVSRSLMQCDYSWKWQMPSCGKSQQRAAGLSILLASQLNERRRHEDALQKQCQLAEQQRRADELAAKLEVCARLNNPWSTRPAERRYSHDACRTGITG